MPARSLALIYRHINRLKDTIGEYAPKHAALAALKPGADAFATQVDDAYKHYVDSIARGDKERTERDTAIDALRGAVSKWRGVVLCTVPGAGATVHALPPRGGTVDDMLRVGDVLVHFIQTNPATAAFRKDALAELGPLLDAARKQTADATSALPAQQAAREAFSAACLAANPFLVHATEVLRAIFGPHSQQYKQFIEHDLRDHAQVDAAANAGEPIAAPAAAG